jgi:hypothetical protein
MPRNAEKAIMTISARMFCRVEGTSRTYQCF